MLKNINKGILNHFSVLCLLKGPCIRITSKRDQGIITKKRTPMPVKTILAGENAYEIDISRGAR